MTQRYAPNVDYNANVIVDKQPYAADDALNPTRPNPFGVPWMEPAGKPGKGKKDKRRRGGGNLMDSGPDDAPALCCV